MAPAHGTIGVHGKTECAPEVARVTFLVHALTFDAPQFLGFGYLLPLLYLLWSLKWGPAAGRNPWHATGLEWQTATPPPKHNFDTVPVVTGGPYEYTPETGGYSPQNQPEEKLAHV